MGVKQTLSPYCISYVKEFEFTIIGYCGILLLGTLSELCFASHLLMGIIPFPTETLGDSTRSPQCP